MIPYADPQTARTLRLRGRRHSARGPQRRGGRSRPAEGRYDQLGADPQGGGEDRQLRAEGECSPIGGKREDGQRSAIASSGVGQAQMVQGLAQTPRRDGAGFVLVKQLRPARGVRWVTDWDRCQDGNPDGIRYLVALPQAPVLAADRKRDDGSDQRAASRPKPSGDEQTFGQRRPGSDRRLLQQPCLLPAHRASVELM